MKKTNRLNYIDISLRVLNIQLSPDILKKVVDVVDLVDKKRGDTDIKDILERS